MNYVTFYNKTTQLTIVNDNLIAKYNSVKTAITQSRKWLNRRDWKTNQTLRGVMEIRIDRKVRA